MRVIINEVLLFIFCLLASLLFASAISSVVLFFTDSMDILSKISTQSTLSNKELNILKINQLFYTIIVFGFAAALFSYFKTKSFFKFYTIKNNNFSWDFLHLIPLLILFYPLVVFSFEINSLVEFPEKFKYLETALMQKEKEAEWLTKIILETDSTVVLLFNILIVAIVPAIFEEILFRGCLQQSIYKKTNNILLSIFISAFLFSAIHMQFYGFLPRILLGALLGWVYYITGNITYPIVLHLINNASQVILVFIVKKLQLPWDVYEPETIKLIPTIISTVLFIILASQFKTKYQLKNE